MLNIKPFVYGAKIINCFDGSLIFHPRFIDFSESGLGHEALMLAVYHQTLSFPQVIVDGFRNLVAVSVETNYDFKQAEGFKNNLNSGVAFDNSPNIDINILNIVSGGDVATLGNDEDSSSSGGFGEDPFSLDFF